MQKVRPLLTVLYDSIVKATVLVIRRGGLLSLLVTVTTEVIRNFQEWGKTKD